MDSFTVICKNITPLIMSGVNQKKAEFRAASVKGMMRWWFRIAGGSREDENWLFGSTNVAYEIQNTKKKEIRALSSPFSIRVRHIDGPGTYSTDDLRSDTTIPRYFSFPFFLRGGQREAFKPGNSFEIQLSFLPGLSQRDCEKILASLWFAIYLGNFGFRSRKGFGSFIVKESSSFPEVWKNVETIQNKTEFYKKSIASWVQKLSPSTCFIDYVFYTETSWKVVARHYADARKAIGKPKKFFMGYPFHPDEGEIFDDIERFASPILLKPISDHEIIMVLLNIQLKVIKSIEEVKQKFKTKDFIDSMKTLNEKMIIPLRFRTSWDLKSYLENKQ